MNDASTEQSAIVQVEVHQTIAILSLYFVKVQDQSGERFGQKSLLDFVHYLAPYLGTDVYDRQELTQRVEHGLSDWLKITSSPLRNFINGVSEGGPRTVVITGIVGALAGDRETLR